MPRLVVENVVKSYGDRRVLDAVRAAFDCGGVFAIVGPNGSGKTTLLRIAALLENPDSGSVSIDGLRLSGLRGRALTAIRRRICFIAQDPYMFAGSVLRNVAYAPAARGAGRRRARETALAELDRLGMAPFAGARAAGLSAGERQKAALARGFASGAEFLLLDEPTANVDRASVPLVEGRIAALAAGGAACVVATHDAGLGRRIARDSTLRLDCGRIVAGARENYFTGTAARAGESPGFLADSGVLLAAHSDGPVEGRCSASISPDEILLSTSPVSSSARNVLEGTVRKIEMEGGRVYVTVDAGIDLVLSITPESRAALDVHPGLKVFAFFKASAVRLHAAGR